MRRLHDAYDRVMHRLGSLIYPLVMIGFTIAWALSPYTLFVAFKTGCIPSFLTKASWWTPAECLSVPTAGIYPHFLFWLYLLPILLWTALLGIFLMAAAQHVYGKLTAPRSASMAPQQDRKPE